ncbi:DER1-domain-containing protein [Acrodontium crateriforme]|uniref:Derlin n=1 Tax=Acrodontium crateriforme TaxID=150365 RepID=A0AAQ3R302_9PEZI|nr:DER1-domain-containing protein [Acrodontium crateriforme]
MEFFWATPPVTRTLVATSVIMSALAHFGTIDIMKTIFIPEYIFTYRMVPQVWRLATSFLLTGPSFGILMDPYFLYTYSLALEKSGSKFRTSSDYSVFIVFVWAIIMPLAGLWLGWPFLMSSFLMALAYTYAQEDPNRQVNYFIVTLSAKYIIYAQLIVTCIATGGYYHAFVQATGIPAAHLYLFLTKYWPEYGGGTHWIFTPNFLRQYLDAPAGTGVNRGAGTAFPARNAGGAQAGRGGGWTSAFSAGGGTWNQRGPGRRLGD